MLPLNLQLAIRELIPLVRGWSGKEQRLFRMAELILQERPQIVVEIGVFGGQSLIPQAMALKALGNGQIFGIDPYNLEVIKEQLADMDDRPMWLKQDMNIVRNDTLQMIRELGLEHHAILIIAESRDCPLLFPQIDILHIDGAHTEEGVILDVRLFAKRVREGGFIWMDDTHFPSVQPALRELETFAELVDDWSGYRLYKCK
jgi:cephalosporin hydroxylase